MCTFLDLKFITYDEVYLSQLLQSCSKTLRVLRWRNGGLTLSQVVNFATEYCELDTLDIGDCSFGRDTVFDELKFKRLKMTRVYDIKDVQLQTLLGQCQQLTHLTLNRCKFDALSLFKTVQQLPQLRCFIYKNYPGLETLKYPTGLLVSGSMKSFPALRCLNLRRYTDIPSNALIAIIRACPELLELNLSGLSSVTDGVLDCCYSYCSELLFMDISHCKSCTHEGIAKLAEKLKNKLVYLNVAHTDFTVKSTEELTLKLQIKEVVLS